MNPYALRQAESCGGQWTGLDATPTGSAATNDVVADFTGATQTLFPLASVAVPVIHTPSQTLGSTFKVAIEGVWVFIAKLATQGAGAVALGLGIDNVAAELNTDPLAPINARLLDQWLHVPPGAMFSGCYATSGPLVITRELALDPARALVRVLASNGANAGVAAASLVLNVCYFKALRIGDVPAVGAIR